MPLLLGRNEKSTSKWWGIRNTFSSLDCSLPFLPGEGKKIHWILVNSVLHVGRSWDSTWDGVGTQSGTGLGLKEDQWYLLGPMHTSEVLCSITKTDKSPLSPPPPDKISAYISDIVYKSKNVYLKTSSYTHVDTTC